MLGKNFSRQHYVNTTVLRAWFLELSWLSGKNKKINISVKCTTRMERQLSVKHLFFSGGGWVGGGGGGGGSGGSEGCNCGTDMRASISKPTPFIYLAFEKNTHSWNVDLFIYCPLNFFIPILVTSTLRCLQTCLQKKKKKKKKKIQLHFTNKNLFIYHLVHLQAFTLTQLSNPAIPSGLI